MSELKGVPGELRLTLQITRKATGKVETVELIGRVLPENLEKESEDVGHSQHGGA